MLINPINNNYSQKSYSTPNFGAKIPYNKGIAGAFDYAEQQARRYNDNRFSLGKVLDFCDGIKTLLEKYPHGKVTFDEAIEENFWQKYLTTSLNINMSTKESTPIREEYNSARNRGYFDLISNYSDKNRRKEVWDEGAHHRAIRELVNLREKVKNQSNKYEIDSVDAKNAEKAELKEIKESISIAKTELQTLNEYRTKLNNDIQRSEKRLARLDKEIKAKENAANNEVHYGFVDRMRILFGLQPKKRK